MSAATAARDAKRKEGMIAAHPLAAATQVWKGTLVSTRVADGYLYPARSGTATDLFRGVAGESRLGDGTDGSAKCKVEKRGIFQFVASGLAQTDEGVAVYASDDSTVTKTSTNNQLVGYITKVVSATLCEVRIDLAVK